METETEKQIWESKNIRLTLASEQAEVIKEQYSSLKNHLDEEQKRLINQAKAEAKKIIQEANSRINETYLGEFYCRDLKCQAEIDTIWDIKRTIMPSNIYCK